MNKTIIWEKWRDPFLGYDENEIDIENRDLNHLFEDDELQDDKDDIDPSKYKLDKQIRVISTPMGLIPYNEYTASSKIFNFWMGHTNFNISREVSKLIENTDGVETLDIFTRYRFRVAIGKAFEDREVLQNIDLKIKNYE